MAEHASGRKSWHLWAILGGFSWCTGAVLNFVASRALLIDRAISYTIGQGATLVSAVWGVFVWNEFAIAPPDAPKLIPLMFAFFLGGLGSVALAPVFSAMNGPLVNRSSARESPIQRGGDRHAEQAAGRRQYQY
jgi:glucose uptake protein